MGMEMAMMDDGCALAEGVECDYLWHVRFS